MASTKQLLTCLHVALSIQLVFAQDRQCYYPNGNPGGEKPCSSSGDSACCPDKWQCLDNGLCHYPPDNLYARYSCTDKSWDAEACASNMCTYGMATAGGESITQCSDHDNQWCCNGDNNIVNCCKGEPEPRPFFDLPEGKQYAVIGESQASQAPNLQSFTGIATSGGGSQPSATPNSQPSSQSGSSQSSASSSSSSATSVTSLQTSVSSGTAGVSTIIQTTIISPSSTTGPSPTQPSEKKSNIGVIVGCAVGIPLAIAFASIMFWLFRKRHLQKKNARYTETPDPYANGTASPHFAGGAKLNKPSSEYKSEVSVPEMAGQPIGPGRPISTVKGHAELDSGAGFTQGTVPYAPNFVGVGGGTGHTPQSSWGSAPPGYSPGMNQNAFSGVAAAAAPTQTRPDMVEAMDTQVSRPSTGGATQTEGGRYIPYRPPQGHDAHRPSHLAEMSAVRTPPDELPELATQRSPPDLPELRTERSPPT